MQTAPAQTLCPINPKRLSEPPVEPLISILLANYNYARYIGQSIESVLAQTYRNWELIICDDGSADESPSIIGRFANRDSRIKALYQPNGGHTSALNAAFALCQGEVVCFLDSDDLYLPGKLESVVAACANDPVAGLVIHRVIRVNERRRKQGVWPLSNLPGGWLGPELLKAGGVMPYAPPTSGIALRREIADLLFPLSMEPPLDMCPDQVIMRLAPLLTAVRRMPDALAEYRVHGANSYSGRAVNAQAVKRQLEVSRALWRAQYGLLFAIQPEIAASLSPLEVSQTTALLQYIEAKLLKAPDVAVFHQKLLDASKRQGKDTLLPFWRMSIRLPNFLFRPAINLLLGQSVLKQFVARLKKLA
jgi:hypothetical protein